MCMPKESTLFVIFLLIVLKCAIGINIIPDYFMKSGALGNCGDTITNKEDVYVRSHIGAYQLGSIINYGANENCKLTFDAGAGKKVLVKFLNFKLELPSAGNCVDGLNIYNGSQLGNSNNSPQVCYSLVLDNSTVLCNYTVPDNSSLACNSSAPDNSSLSCNYTVPDNSSLACNSSAPDNSSLSCNYTVPDNSSTECSNSSVYINVTVPCNDSTPDSMSPALTRCGTTGLTPFVSDGPEVTFEFFTNGNSHFSGFKLLVTAFREDNTCTSNEFQCDTNRCIQKDLTCDTVEHCVDNTDENDALAGCTILDKIIGYVFGLGNMTVITIAVLGGVLIFTIITSIIVYQVCCKKKSNSVRSTLSSEITQGQSSETNKKEKRKVIVVEPPPVESPPAPAKTAWDKKSTKKEKQNDDEFW